MDIQNCFRMPLNDSEISLFFKFYWFVLRALIYKEIFTAAISEILFTSFDIYISRSNVAKVNNILKYAYFNTSMKCGVSHSPVHSGTVTEDNNQESSHVLDILTLL
jgi:hypothetical protein